MNIYDLNIQTYRFLKNFSDFHGFWAKNVYPNYVKIYMKTNARCCGPSIFGNIHIKLAENGYF